jgi:GDSL-like Lipase/Acylhydrolase family
LTEKKASTRVAAFAVTLVLLALGAALLELASGYLLKNPALGARQKLLDAILDSGSLLPLNINNNPDSKLSPHPFLLYVNTPNYDKQLDKSAGPTEHEHNSLGYRSPETTEIKPNGVYRVLALGGSTTYGIAVPDFRDAWPYQLQELMNKNPPRGYARVEVLNGGLTNATSAELLAGWVFRHQYMKPDLVVIHTGGNDIYPLLYPEYNPEYTHLRARGVTFYIPARNLVRKLTELSNTIRLLSLKLLPEDLMIPVYIANPGALEDIELSTLEQRVNNTYPLGFERNLDTLVRSVQMDDIPIALVSFALAPVDWIRENADQMGRHAHVLALGLSKNQQVMRKISQRNSVPYMEFTTEQLPVDYFVDYCHMNEAGEHQKATIIHEFLTTNHLWPNDTVGSP